MRDPLHARLGSREREILEAVYALGAASATEVVEYLDDPDGYDSIRITLANLERKGLLEREREGRSYTYSPAVSPEAARGPAMSRLLRTFFAGSTSRAVLAFLDMSEDELSEEELDRIAAWIEEHGGSAEANGATDGGG